ncbi:MAG: hypothetical protein IPF62_12070 [Bacteroidetes bacterium]|nr:hypothetical protein [Bacteroidota bacterium]
MIRHIGDVEWLLAKMFLQATYMLARIVIEKHDTKRMDKSDRTSKDYVNIFAPKAL